MNPKFTREEIVNFLTKINSEGIEYYFIHYANPASFQYNDERESPLKKEAEAFVEAFYQLETRIQDLMDEYNICDEDVEI